MTMILNIDGSRSCVLMAQDLLNAPHPTHTLGTQKFRNILLFEDSPLDEFWNIDFGITCCFDSQGPKLGG